jgi:hypothetical protein
VDVGVDQARGDEALFEVDRPPGGPVLAQPGDPAARERDSGLVHLAGQDVDQPRIGEQKVRGLIASGDREQMRQVHAPSYAGSLGATIHRMM